MVIMLIFIGIAAFMAGFLLGVSGEPPRESRPQHRRHYNTRAAERFTKEYQNFLNYDGTEQE